MRKEYVEQWQLDHFKIELAHKATMDNIWYRGRVSEVEIENRKLRKQLDALLEYLGLEMEDQPAQTVCVKKEDGR